jgi:hypothetical protein
VPEFGQGDDPARGRRFVHMLQQGFWRLLDLSVHVDYSVEVFDTLDLFLLIHS